MNWMELLNVVFNLAGFIGMTSFLILVYGRPNSTVHKWSGFANIVIKASMALIAGGHLLQAVDHNKPTFGHLIMTAGLAMMWFWTTWFHWFIFIKPVVNKESDFSMCKAPEDYVDSVGFKRPK